MGCVSSTLTYRTRDSLERGRLFFLSNKEPSARTGPWAGPVRAFRGYFRLYGSRRWTCTSIGHPRCLSYKSGLCRKTFAERRFDVQVSKNSADILPLPKDLSRKPTPEALSRVQAKLVHRVIEKWTCSLFLFG